MALNAAAVAVEALVGEADLGGGWFESGLTLLSPPLDAEDDTLLLSLPTDELGMLIGDADTEWTDSAAGLALKRPGKSPQKKITRRYVSKHFKTTAKPERVLGAPTPPTTPLKAKITTSIIGEELSSDSELSDVPSDIGPDPFSDASHQEHLVTSKPDAKVKLPTKSPYFPSKPRPRFISCLPFPPLSDQHFGLMQERLAYDPFRLLIATIFLNRTRGEQAMPVFFQLMERYPTVQSLAEAELEDVVEILRCLGFQNQRARKCIDMAKMWKDVAPQPNNRYRKLNYPVKGDGKDVAAGEIIDDDDSRIAWEISHLPGLGPYSHDSWRIFCRDRLRGLSGSWNGEGAMDGFEPEWKRVVPLDKELRAYLSWMWLKEGWLYNKETGSVTMASDELMDRARTGGIVQEQQETDHLILSSMPHGIVSGAGIAVEKPAGQFLPNIVSDNDN